MNKKLHCQQKMKACSERDDYNFLFIESCLLVFFFSRGWGSEKYSRCGMHDIYVYHNDSQFMDSYSIDVCDRNNDLNVVSPDHTFIIFMT